MGWWRGEHRGDKRTVKRETKQITGLRDWEEESNRKEERVAGAADTIICLGDQQITELNHEERYEASAASSLSNVKTFVVVSFIWIQIKLWTQVLD